MGAGSKATARVKDDRADASKKGRISALLARPLLAEEDARGILGPAMAAGVTDWLWKIEDIVKLTE